MCILRAALAQVRHEPVESSPADAETRHRPPPCDRRLDTDEMTVMTIRAYYLHLRRMAPFRAIDCLVLARQAAELDQHSTERRIRAVPFVDVSAEDGIRLSRVIRVF
jgi:hypothetical protein